MRDPRALNYALIAVVLPLWLVVTALSLQGGFRTGHPPLHFGLSSASGPSDYPTVYMSRRPELQAGDRLLRIAGHDLVGSNALRVRALAYDEPLDLPLPVSIERAGQVLQLQLVHERSSVWWAFHLFLAGLFLCSVVVLLRAPEWPLARRAALAGLAFALAPPPPGDLELMMVLAPTVRVLIAAGFVLTLWTALDFPESSGRTRRWERALPWLFGSVILGLSLYVDYRPLPEPAGLLFRVIAGVIVAWCVALLWLLARSYRSADSLGRRQLRWLVWGFYVGVVPYLSHSMADVLGWVEARDFLFGLLPLFLLAVPIGMVVAVAGYRFLDIDRVISATASVTILGLVLIGAALAVIPDLSLQLGDVLGVAPRATQWVLSVAMAGVLLPVHRALRPWIDQRLFREHERLERGFESLVGALAECRSADDLTKRAGEGLDALLEPDSIASYARSGDAFVPIFTRGSAVPPAFAADSVLVQALAARPVAISSRTADLGPFDRAALETLGAELVGPTRRGSDLVAFTCLGPKRSKDVYTPTDRALFTAVLNRCSDVLARIDGEEVARQGASMQERLRRYVPGVLASQLEAGREPATGERDVSILFVDIRGYASFVQSREIEDVFATVNRHTERLSGIVDQHGGVVVEFGGDGMMAVFGAPDPLPNKERAAVEAAREILAAVESPIRVGVGIATGLGFAGSIRSADRLIWTVIGDTTNLASRLQALTRDLDAAIAIDEETRRAADYVCADFELHADVAIRGQRDRRDVYALPLA